MVVLVDLRMVMGLQDNREKRKLNIRGITQKVFPAETGNYMVL